MDRRLFDEDDPHRRIATHVCLGGSGQGSLQQQGTLQPMGVRDLAKAIEMLGRAPRGVGAARTLRDATGGQVGPRERSRLARLLAEEGTTFTPAARLAVAQLIEATHHEIARTLHLCDELPDVTFTVAGDYRTTDLEEPSAIALLPDGFLLLVDDESGLHEARRPKAAETEVRTQAVAGGAFANAEGLAFDPTSGSVFTLIEDGSLWRQTIRRAGAGVELGPTVNAGSSRSWETRSRDGRGCAFLPLRSRRTNEATFSPCMKRTHACSGSSPGSRSLPRH
ncbi:MAG: hypothetical protein IPK07_26475 [Deltaproteobacteria bacterium]|nr:hypothetical protein [Deltaproteobacteria bacterium]